MSIRPAFAFALFLLACCGLAQTTPQRGAAKPQRTKAFCSPIDTRSFFPQIQDSISVKPISVRQGALFNDPPTTPNNLAAGGLFGESSFAPGAMFPGISQSGWTPGDPDIAVGTGHIVEVINSEIGFFTKAGVLQVQQNSGVFFAGMGATAFQFDPKVSYDRVHDRFVLVFLEYSDSPSNVSKVLVAVSDDGNPNGTWYRYRVEAKLTLGGNDYWMDYPGLGHNKDAYVVNGNMFPFTFGGFGGVQFIVMPSAPMLSGGAVTVTSLRDASGASAQTADTIDLTQPNVFAVSRRNATTVRVNAILDPAGTPIMATTDVAVPSHASPAGDAESTNGNFLDVIDARVYNAVWRGGRLLAAHNFEGTTFVGSRWYELDTGTWPTSGSVTLVQSGGIQSATNNYFCPAINKNATGKISAILTSSSTTVTADFALSTRLPGDALGTMGAPSILETSLGNNYTQGRWGDYFCVDVDPVDDVTFWGVHMIVSSTNAFLTRINSWTVPGVTTHAPGAYSWARGFPQSGNIASLAADDNDYNVTKAGLVLFPSEPPAQLVTETFAPSSVVYGIDLNVIAKVNTTGLDQRVEIWNYTTGAWITLGQMAATTAESSQLVSSTGNPLDYVEAVTHRVKVKVSWLRTGLTLLYPWTVSVDQVQWSINGA